MRSTARLALTLLLAALVVSCSSSPKQPSESQPLPFIGGTSTGGDATPLVGAVNLPPGAQRTIVCHTIGGPGHITAANNFKAQLLKLPELAHMRDWFVVHHENYSVLYYGYYGDTSHPETNSAAQKELDRYRADQKTLATLIDLSTGQKLFPQTRLVPIGDGAGASGPAEWDLKNAKGVYTLQVAVYLSGNRRQNCLDTVREARKQGFEAYYFHDDVASVVCIGVWPESAVRIHEARGGKDHNAVLLVLSPGVPRMPNVPMYTPDGRPIKVLQPRVEVVDQTLIDTMRRLPHCAIDDQILTRRRQNSDGTVTSLKDASVVVRIPGRGEEPPTRTTPAPPPIDPNLLRPSSDPNAPGGGRLRSLDGK